MTEIKIINSSFTVIITLQTLTSDNMRPLLEAIQRNGFAINAIENSPPFAWKDTTNNLRIEFNNRRILFNITNNLLSPDKNLVEVFSILSKTGYPMDESVERIEITGMITVKTINDTATSFVPEVVKEEFKHKIDNIFNRTTRVTGIRLTSEESLLGDITKSPFALLIEPLFTDMSNTKFIVN